MHSATDCPKLSIVIPVVERHSDLSRLFSVYRDEVRRTGYSAEFLFVIDRRKQDTLPELRRLQEESSEEISLFMLGGEFGESTALSFGIQKARGELIVTVASYFQIDPQGFAQAVHLVDSGEADVVVGRRYPRTDSGFNRAQSLLFHFVVRTLTKTTFHDLSCGFRVLRADAARDLLIYGGLHRFVPILAHNQGFHVREILLRQHQEDATTRYYGVALYVKRLLDILTVYFITKFTKRPLRFFGPLGLALALPGVLLTAYLGVYRLLGLGPIADRPLLLLAVLLMVVGFQSLSLGLIGEVIIFTHARQLSQYRVAEVIRATRNAPSPDWVTAADASTSAAVGAAAVPLPVVTQFKPRSS
jgi:glycosyltransferase involved in cell wall biosynthesis